ncbi:MAG TPA: GlsB/YeaQ/YmgE family stress response membrane protein [Novosphingobium sp.]|nr:GlsB/YeaQ/YmgE family stress response membrane protein [Novosphingobium sp.]
MLNIIGALISGLFVGALARWFYPGPVEMGWWMTAFLGMGGALVVGVLTSLTSRQGIGEGFNRAGCLASVLGAMALIWIGRHYGWSF